MKDENGSNKDDDGAINPGSNLFVTGIHPRLSEAEVTRLFEKYGEVEKCQIMRDPHSKESRGFGFVKMVTSDQADAAKEGLQGELIEGRTLSIEKARRSPAAHAHSGQVLRPAEAWYVTVSPSPSPSRTASSDVQQTFQSPVGASTTVAVAAALEPTAPAAAAAAAATVARIRTRYRSSGYDRRGDDRGGYERGSGYDRNYDRGGYDRGYDRGFREPREYDRGYRGGGGAGEERGYDRRGDDGYVRPERPDRTDRYGSGGGSASGGGGASAGGGGAREDRERFSGPREERRGGGGYDRDREYRGDRDGAPRTRDAPAAYGGDSAPRGDARESYAGGMQES